MNHVILNYFQCKSYDDFITFENTHQITKNNVLFELSISKNYAIIRQPFTLNGYCTVCRKDVTFVVSWGDPAIYKIHHSNPHFLNTNALPCWRELVQCPDCGLNSRMRAAIHLIETVLPKNSLIHVAEQGGMFIELSKRFSLLIGSEYFNDGTPIGASNHNRFRFEDITQLSFPDSSLDAQVSFDVFEHVPNYKLAIKEIHRVLKVGGTTIFTAPFILFNKMTKILAKIDETGSVTHYSEPEWHISNAGPVLCYQHFGWDLLAELRDAGFREAQILLNWNPHRGHLGQGDMGVDTIIMATK